MVDKQYVFISYSSKDISFVNRIIKELKVMGIDYWKAPEMIPAGSSYAKEIPKAIQNCSIFLLVLSPDSQNSIWVEKEIDSAICNRKTIIPFQIKEVELNDTLRFYLNNIQIVKYSDSADKSFDKLKQHIFQLMFGNISEEKEKDAGTKKIEVNNKLETSATKTVSGLKSSNPGRKKRDSNVLRMNRIPLECQYCGFQELENVTIGTYRCLSCGKENYDDFQTIRNYLEKAGARSAYIIERDTGVPRRVIEHFFKEEYLEIPINSSIRVPCQSCGAPIRTGTLCDYCKSNSEKKSQTKTTGRWHSRL